MKCELDKQDLISLVKGITPHYDVMDHKLIAPYGHFIGGHLDKWNWDLDALEELTEDHLYLTYLFIKSFAAFKEKQIA